MYLVLVEAQHRATGLFDGCRRDACDGFLACLLYTVYTATEVPAEWRTRRSGSCLTVVSVEAIPRCRRCSDPDERVRVGVVLISETVDLLLDCLNTGRFDRHVREGVLDEASLEGEKDRITPVSRAFTTSCTADATDVLRSRGGDPNLGAVYARDIGVVER